MSSDLETSRRFTKIKERRDFLGMAAIWSAVAALTTALVGAFRLPMPAVFPESNPRRKLGPMKGFLGIDVTALAELRLWILRDQDGLFAVSGVCPHLGCVVSRQENGEYLCPCHGSRFDSVGRVVAGPAPRGLVYFELSLAPDGQLVVDQQKEVTPETRLNA